MSLVPLSKFTGFSNTCNLEKADYKALSDMLLKKYTNKKYTTDGTDKTLAFFFVIFLEGSFFQMEYQVNVLITI